MPRQSHAAKAFKLFSEMLLDFEAIFMRCAEMVQPSSLAAGLQTAGARIHALSAAASEGVQSALEAAQTEVAAWLHRAEAPSAQGPAARAGRAPADGDMLGWSNNDWMDDDSGSDREAHGHVSPEDCGLAGVTSAEAAL